MAGGEGEDAATRLRHSTSEIAGREGGREGWRSGYPMHAPFRGFSVRSPSVWSPFFLLFCACFQWKIEMSAWTCRHPKSKSIRLLLHNSIPLHSLIHTLQHLASSYSLLIFGRELQPGTFWGAYHSTFHSSSNPPSPPSLPVTPVSVRSSRPSKSDVSSADRCRLIAILFCWYRYLSLPHLALSFCAPPSLHYTYVARHLPRFQRNISASPFVHALHPSLPR